MAGAACIFLLKNDRPEDRLMKLALIALLAFPLSSAQPRLQTSTPVSSSAAQPGGAHGVRNEQYGLFLRPRDASNRDGEPIVLYPYQTWKCMAWHFEDASGSTRLVNFFTGKSFEVQQSAAGKTLVQMPSSPEQQKNEGFRFVPVEHGLYEIVSGSGDALTAIDSDGHGDIRVVVSPWKNLPSQRWQLVDIPEHFTG
jgi:hypothetical protein